MLMIIKDRVSFLKKAACVLTALCIFFSQVISADASIDMETYDLINEMMYSYKMDPEGSAAEVRELISRLKQKDPELGKIWEQLMEYWVYVNRDLSVNYGLLPNGLPRDSSLCIVVLGYQLNPDGSMADELIARCQVALDCARQYPESVIAVTGGGTAFRAPELTEAGQMADWLIRNGIDENRILVEDQSQTTVENAQFTYDMLRAEQPQVRAVAIVSSDYHIPLGCLLFQETFLFAAWQDGCEPLNVFTNAGCHEETLYEFTVKYQASDLWITASRYLME